MKSKRHLLFVILFCICFLLLILQAFRLQVVKGEYYAQYAEKRLLKTEEMKGVRGGILDKNGVPLVSNEPSYIIKIDKSLLGDEDVNVLIKRLMMVTQWEESRLTDEEYDTLEKKFPQSHEDTREVKEQILSVRKAMEKAGYGLSTPYVFCKDITMEAITAIKEGGDDFKGATIALSFKRSYGQGSTAAHLLGQMGLVEEGEYETLKKEGYRLDDMVGKSGVEKAFENYLKPTHGTGVTEQELKTGAVYQTVTKEPIAGNNVRLTLDGDLQKCAEAALAVWGEKNPLTTGAAAVVIEVNTGKILAMASYPTYDPETYHGIYGELINDPNKPTYHRALQGVYEPGSTFKMLTLLAGMEKGAIDSHTKIKCGGFYEYYAPAYRPRCWIQTSKGHGHGTLDGVGALVNSCNVFLFEAGRRTGIDAMNQYSRLFGFGEKTGIELEYESVGSVAGKENSKEKGTLWYEGSTIQAAIGQGENLFTPLQMANYVATLANGGTRYALTLLEQVEDYQTGTPIFKNTQRVEEVISLKDSTYEMIYQGMRGVCKGGGTAGSVFGNYPIAVAGKTGSAQVGSGAANGLFVGFAPYEKPEIAIAVVLEHGESGINGAKVAKKILDGYFGLGEQDIFMQNKKMLKITHI